MPSLSPTMTHGNLVAWSKQVGDQLAPGDVLAELETDKAQMDFEFQDDGYLAKILVPEGTKDVPINKPIAVYVEDADDVAAFKDFKIEDSADAAATTTTTEVKEEKPQQPEKINAQQQPTQKSKEQKSSPVTQEDTTGRIIASPLAKKIALENGVALKGFKGSGPHGRIVKDDVLKLVEQQKKAATATAASPKGPSSTSGTGISSYEDVEISNMRKIIGDRLLQSTQGIPSYIISSDISVSKLLKLRKSLNSTAKDKYKLSINDILIKAVTVAAKRVPDANAYWRPDGQDIIRKFKNVDVSVAVATPTGLLTPIVKNADSKGLVTISNEVKELVKRAKINKLAPEEFQGGTICISNMGMNDSISMFTSIINPPQSTILAIGTVKKVAVEDAGAESGFCFDEQMTITGTFDHRTIDGAKGADFMKELKTVIENPLELLL